MNLHLVVIANQIAPGAHAALLVDQAGSSVGPAHRAAQHHVDPVAAEMPRAEPKENIWQFMRDNWLSSRVFKSFDDIRRTAAMLWNKLVDHPWRIMSIALRDWAYRS
jgi:hypothetical protein